MMILTGINSEITLLKAIQIYSVGSISLYDEGPNTTNTEDEGQRDGTKQRNPNSLTITRGASGPGCSQDYQQKTAQPWSRCWRIPWELLSPDTLAEQVGCRGTGLTWGCECSSWSQTMGQKVHLFGVPATGETGICLYGVCSCLPRKRQSFVSTCLCNF